jgi:hypothetical protein
MKLHYFADTDVPFAFTHNLDLDRNIDYGPDNLPIGVEFLGVSQGLDLTDLPQRADLARLLAEAHLPGWDTA